MIKINNLTKKIDNRYIFKSLNLKIKTNKITFVIGKSGIGKTTLINLIANFTKKDKGEILFYKDGKQIKNPLIDVVFQDFNLIPQLSVKNNILIGNSIIEKNFDLNLLEKSASFLNIQNSKLAQETKDLSGGEKQRVAILRAFSRNSDFILLDEPTGNLDKENAIAVFDSLVKLAKNKTILVVSHNLELAKLYADQIIHIKSDFVETEIIKREKNNQENESQNFLFDSNIQKKRPNLWVKFKTGVFLSIVDFKSKITTTILLIFSFLVTIFGIVLFGVLNLKVQGTNIQKIYQHQLDSILIRKTNYNDRFLPDEIKKIEENGEKITKILPFYIPPQMNFSYRGSKFIQFPVDFIDETDFFSKRFKPDSNDFQGKFIKNENEIIVSKSLASELKIENPIGKKIRFIDPINSRFDNKELLIVGVNNSFNDQNVNLSFLNFNLIKSTFTTNWKNDSEKNQIFDYLSSNGLGKNIPISKNYYENQDEIKNLRILEGNFPKNSSEIAISKNVQDLLNFNNKPSLINSSIYSISITNDQKFNFKIVGIFDENNKNNSNETSKVNEKDIEQNKIVLNHSIIEKTRDLNPLFLKVFFDHKNLNEYIEKFTSQFPEYKRIEKSNVINHLIISSQILTQLIILIVLIVFSISLFVLIIFYAKNLTDSKKKMIGILKALGAKTIKIFLYHWMTLILISLLIFVFGLVLIVPIAPEIYTLITKQTFTFPLYSQVSAYFLIVWISMVFILSFIYLIISWFFYRKSVVNLLK
ncbi:ATP-binding cassette domain-containing protein [Mesomycoplasma dispar]|uniref:ABC transporter ATP-binding protein n=1 Tax=Mesomycoplasma dispar TaxID=86660 RepID=A0ABM6PSH1_9BACT|nr:ATP-binding cassette domain-containing protein [Mesomycoplasma dispar]ATP59973.1 ABC transporter ATP-binding protein [Mesomycoplasma dispar]